MPAIRSRDPFVMAPGGEGVPWPPQNDQYTDGAKRALSFAQDEAARLDHNHVGPIHLLVGAVREEHGLPARIFAEMGVTVDQLRKALLSTMGRGAGPIDPSDITLTPHSQRVIDVAVHESRRLMHPATDTEHLLLAVIREGETFSSRVLDSLGLDREKLLETIVGQLDVPASYRAAENATPLQGPYEHFDVSTTRTLAFAQEEAANMGHHWVGAEHLVLGLARVADVAAPDSPIRRGFTELQLTLERLRTEVGKIQPPRTARHVTDDMKFNGSAKLIIELAIDEAGSGNTVLPEHLLLAIGRSRDALGGYALSQLGATPERVHAVIRQRRTHD
jgi:ATP-dependent Clp protease ATP-binding subunit ClpA